MQEHTQMSNTLGTATDIKALHAFRLRLIGHLEREPDSMLLKGYIEAVEARIEQVTMIRTSSNND